MGLLVVIGLVLLVLVIKGVIQGINQTPEREELELYGPSNLLMVCPHCHQKGGIRTKKVTLKKGISGGKATAAALTGGLSMLATGLSRKEDMTQARCSACNNTWIF